MHVRRSTNLSHILDKWPGKRIFGVYRFLPIFFFLGAAVEFSMIKWHVGEVNFYKVYKRKQAALKVQELETVSSS